MTATRPFYRSLSLLIGLNLLVKPLWIFGIDRPVQNLVGHAAYGTYFALLNLTLILNILLDLGITPFLNRSVAAHPDEGPSLFLRAVRGKLLLTLLFTAVVTIIAWLTGIRDFFLLLSLILLQIMTGFNMFFRGYLSARQLFVSDAVVSVTDKFLVILIAGAVLIFPDTWGMMTVERFAWIQIGALFASVSLSLILLSRHDAGVKISAGGSFDRQLFLDTLPYAFNVFLMSALARADGYLLERIHPDGAREAGVYATGFRLLDAFNMVGALFAGFLLPYIARHWPNRIVIDRVMLLCRHFLLFTGAMAVAFVAALPSWVDQLLYHDTSPVHAKVIMFSISVLPFLSLTHIYGTLLTAVQEIGLFLRITLAATVFNIILNLLLIPHYGALGCAYAALLSQAGYAMAVMNAARRRTGIAIHIYPLFVVSVMAILFYGVAKMAVLFSWPLIPSASMAALILSLIFLKLMKISPAAIWQSISG